MKDNREDRLQLMLNPDELRVIDDFRYRYRLPSRAAAVRELIRRGLASKSTGTADDGSRSKDFGIISTATTSGFRQADE